MRDVKWKKVNNNWSNNENAEFWMRKKNLKLRNKNLNLG